MIHACWCHPSQHLANRGYTFALNFLKTNTMKTKTIKHLILTILMVTFNLSYSQVNTKDVFTSKELVWYGLDFSNARFIGKFNHDFSSRPVSEYELINKYIPAWNSLVIMEPDNFDLKSAFRKKTVYNDLKPVSRKNEAIKEEGIITLNSYSITKDRISQIVSSYAEGDKQEGLGLTCIVESFDKANGQGNFWIVFFDIKTRQVLFSERCSGAPVGFGIRNYWAGALKHVLKTIRYEKYELWKKNSLKGTELTHK